MKAAGQRRSLGWRAEKGSIYEGGHRVPFIARWPGHTPAASVSAELVCVGDMMGTVAALLGAKLPDDAAEDSVNILPALLGKRTAAPLREAIVHHDKDGVFAIRQAAWKLIPAQIPPPYAARPSPAAVPPELYDLAKDPGETTNVAEERPEIVGRLTSLLERYRRPGHSRASAAN